MTMKSDFVRQSKPDLTCVIGFIKREFNVSLEGYTSNLSGIDDVGLVMLDDMFLELVLCFFMSKSQLIK